MTPVFSKGMTLIEVLVASLLLATSVMCLLALQTSAMAITIVSGHRQQASLVLMELSELSFISPTALRELDPMALIAEPIASPNQTCRLSLPCSPEAFLAYELRAWAAEVKNRLPDAQIDIERVWQEGRLSWKVLLSWHGPEDFSQSSLQAELWI
jgi:type IV pilus modification protein PilV